VSNQVEIIYLSGPNSKETGEIIRISPRKALVESGLNALTNKTRYVNWQLTFENFAYDDKNARFKVHF
jgi:hypothetical protein